MKQQEKFDEAWREFTQMGEGARVCHEAGFPAAAEWFFLKGVGCGMEEAQAEIIEALGEACKEGQ